MDRRELAGPGGADDGLGEERVSEPDDSSSIEITPSARAGSSAATAPGSARRRVATVGSEAAAASRSARRVGAGRAPIRAATSPPIVLGTGRGAPGVTVAPCLISDRAISSA